MPPVDETNLTEGAEVAAPTAEERLAKLEGDHVALLEILDRHGINLPTVAPGARTATGATQTVRRLRATGAKK